MSSPQRFLVPAFRSGPSFKPQHLKGGQGRGHPSASEPSFFLMTEDFATAPGTSTFPITLPPWGPGPWLTGQPAKTLLGPFPEKFPALPHNLPPTPTLTLGPGHGEP